MSADSPAPGFTQRWNRFWFERVPSHGICLLRVFFGFTLVMRQTNLYGLYRIDRFEAEIPQYEYSSDSIPHPDFNLPWPFLEWVPAPSLWLYNRIDEALLVLGILFTVGLWTRIVTPIIAGLFIYVIAASQANYYHHIWTFTLAFTFLAFSRCGERFSLDSYLRGPLAPRPDRSILPQRLLQVQITATYFFTFLAKLNHGWLSGDILRIFDESGSLVGPFRAPMLALFGYQGLSLTTLAIEGFLPFALWSPRLRRLAIAAGVLLHLGIDSLMRVSSFSYQMMALYIAFLPPAAGATVVLFDGRCEICRKGRRLVNLLDWLRRLTWLDFRDRSVRERVPGIPAERLEHEMAVITPDGRVSWGFFAWRQIAIRLPLTFLAAGVLYVPGLSLLGRRLYEAISRTRFRRSCCRDGSCNIELAGDAPPGSDASAVRT